MSEVIKKRLPAKYTLDEAFDYSQDSNTLDLEKAIRSISFLLDWGSEGGNKPLNATLALGLAQAANQCAEDAGDLYDSDDIYRLGGDPWKETRR